MPYPFANEPIDFAGRITVNPTKQVAITLFGADADMRVFLENSSRASEVANLAWNQAGPLRLTLSDLFVPGDNNLYIRVVNPAAGGQDVARCEYDIHFDAAEGSVAAAISIADVTVNKADSSLYGGERAKIGVFHHLHYTFIL